MSIIPFPQEIHSINLLREHFLICFISLRNDFQRLAQSLDLTPEPISCKATLKLWFTRIVHKTTLDQLKDNIHATFADIGTDTLEKVNRNVKIRN